MPKIGIDVKRGTLRLTVWVLENAEHIRALPLMVGKAAATELLGSVRHFGNIFALREFDTC
jgi:hypothetical protein